MHDEDLENLEDGIRRLKIEYHIFLTGNRKKPPDELRLRVDRLIKRLSESGEMNFSQRFRFSTLVTRYYVYKDLWRREVQSREMDSTVRGVSALKTANVVHSVEETPETIRISISDPKSEEAKVQQLYNTLLHIRRRKNLEKPISYKQFASYIATQTLNLQKKYGCARVAFTVALHEDELRFTAAADNS